MRECGRTQARVAEYLDVNVRTIQRLEERSKKLKKGEIPQRKVGSGPRRTYGPKQIRAIDKAIDANPRLTCHQLKLQLPKTLAKVAPRTIRRIILEELGCRSPKYLGTNLVTNLSPNLVINLVNHQIW